MEMTFISQKTTSSHEHSQSSKKTDPPPFSLREEKKKKGFSKEIEDVALLVLQEALDEEKALLEGIGTPTAYQNNISSGSFCMTAIQSVDLPSELLELFEKGVNGLAQLTNSGDSETTFFLDTHEFAGAKIIIKEFNTAPKAFNISLVGSPEMAARFNCYLPDLIAAFQKSPFNFTVHRLESDIETHLVERKEDLSDQKEDKEKQ